VSALANCLAGTPFSSPKVFRDDRDVVEPPTDNSEGDNDLIDKFNEVRERLFSTFFFMLGNHEDAQDALQIAFLRCWQARGVLPLLRNLKGWIWRVSLNAGRDLRVRVRRRRTLPLSAVEATALSRPVSPTDALIDQERLERLREALVQLRDEEKQVFLLRQNACLTYREISELRGIPIGTGKTLMHSALKKLRRILAEEEDVDRGQDFSKN
jgi:RNA polymerase sigma-70 factor (ECF subfamily)